MATAKLSEISPKKNFILENKKNISRVCGRNSAHISRSSNEYKNILTSSDKLKITGNKSAPIKNGCACIVSKLNTSKLLLNKNDNNVNNSIENQFSQFEGTLSNCDPLRSVSPDYAKFAALNVGKTYTSKAMQTINITDSEALFNNSVIIYPSSGKKINTLAEHKNEFFETSSLSKIKKNILSSKSLDGNDASSITTDKTDISKLSINENNPSEVSGRRQSRMVKVLKPPNLLKTGKEMVVDPLKAPPTYKLGVLPRYLRNRRYPFRREESNDVCPEGHVTLPDSERKDTLSVLRNRYATLVSELNKMPARLQNAQEKRRKQSLEEELVTVEDGINVFSRPKVYVKLDG